MLSEAFILDVDPRMPRPTILINLSKSDLEAIKRGNSVAMIGPDKNFQVFIGENMEWNEYLTSLEGGVLEIENVALSMDAVNQGLDLKDLFAKE